MHLKNLDEKQFESLSNRLKSELSPFGLEIQWYNQMVLPKFHMKFDGNCLAFLVLSTPDMFENAFLPYLRKHWSDTNSRSDPIDDCMRYHLNVVKENMSELSIEVIHDFEILATKIPRVLVQTAAHVSGAAFYYKPDSVNFENCKKPLGVCIHPEFGGWFGLRAVLIFKDLTTNAIQQKLPKDVITTNEQKRDLIIKFNLNWKDWEYRDIIPVTKRYSDLQKKYFSLKPSERKAFIKELIEIQN